MNEQVPPLPPSPDPPASPEADFARWLHRLRNEVNTATMAAAAAAGLLDAGADQAARDNLQRAREACKRCSALLGEPPAAPGDRAAS